MLSFVYYPWTRYKKETEVGENGLNVPCWFAPTWDDMLIPFPFMEEEKFWEPPPNEPIGLTPPMNNRTRRHSIVSRKTKTHRGPNEMILITLGVWQQNKTNKLNVWKQTMKREEYTTHHKRRHPKRCFGTMRWIVWIRVITKEIIIYHPSIPLRLQA